MRLRDLLEAKNTLPPVEPGMYRLYRGDSNKIDKFDVGLTSFRSLFGKGIYFTDSTRVARDYVSKGDQNNVLFRLSGRNLTKQNVLDYFLRKIAAKIDINGVDHSHEIEYWTKDVPFSNGGDWSVKSGPLAYEETEKRMEYARQKWRELSKTYEIRIKLDGSGVIQKKLSKSTAHVSVFDIPMAYLYDALKADREISEKVLDEIYWILEEFGDKSTANDIRHFIKLESYDTGNNPTFREIYTSIGLDSPLRSDDEAIDTFITNLQEMGYSGIEYIGGITMGNGTKHRAFVLWDAETVNRFRVV